jgi:hypothetical protein
MTGRRTAPRAPARVVRPRTSDAPKLGRSRSSEGAEGIRAIDLQRRLSLRPGPHSRAPSASHRDQLQLLDLPPIRRTVGVLPDRLGANTSATRGSVQLLLAPQDSRLLSLQDLWLHHALQVPKKVGQRHRSHKCDKLRTARTAGGPHSQARWCLHMDVEVSHVSLRERRCAQHTLQRNMILGGHAVRALKKSCVLALHRAHGGRVRRQPSLGKLNA